LLKSIDCESITSIKHSLETVSGVSIDKIDNFIKSFDMNDYESGVIGKQRFQGSWIKLFLEEFKAKFNCKIEINSTHWFHITRVSSKQVFSSGLLPLDKVADDIWSYLFTISDRSEKEWNRFRHSVENNDPIIQKYDGNSMGLYNSKTNNLHCVGPHGFLIREVAFLTEQETGNHDFLLIPEIIQDICRCYSAYFLKDRTNKELEDKYINSTLPCIVKFHTSDNHDLYVGVMLLYLYSLEHKTYYKECNCGINNKGNVVNPENIDYIEFV